MTTFATEMVPPAGNAEGSRPLPDQPRAFSPGELAFLIGVPLLWAILLLFHPGGEGDEIYLDAQDNVTRFLVVHIGMMIFIPLMAVVVYLLLRGVEGTAAWVSRIALVPFVVFYSAWEVLQGIGVGILVNELKGLRQAEPALREDLVQDFAEHPLIGPFGVFGSIGSLGLIVAAIAAGVALYRHAGAPVPVPILLAISGLLITVHPPPYGPTGLALFIVAVMLYVRSQSRERAGRTAATGITRWPLPLGTCMRASHRGPRPRRATRCSRVGGAPVFVRCERRLDACQALAFRRGVSAGCVRCRTLRRSPPWSATV